MVFLPARRLLSVRLRRWPFQIERADELAALVHEIDDPVMIHRIVTGFFARHLFCVRAKGLGDGLGFLWVAG